MPAMVRMSEVLPGPAVCPHDRDDLAFRDLKRHAVERLGVAVWNTSRLATGVSSQRIDSSGGAQCRAAPPSGSPPRWEGEGGG